MRNETRNRLISAVTGLAVVGFLAFLLNPDSAGTSFRAKANRSTAPELDLRQLHGGTWRLSEHRGKVVLVNFWATWCPPCRAETPDLVHLANEYRSKGLQVAGITMDDGDDLGVVREFARSYDIPYPILIPTDELAGRISSLPTTLLIDQQGRVVKTYVGAVRRSQLRSDIDRLLAET